MLALHISLICSMHLCSFDQVHFEPFA